VNSVPFSHLSIIYGSVILYCTILINHYSNHTVEELMSFFLKKGGHIDKYYLQKSNKNKKTLVYLKGWFSGKNIREALLKALAPKPLHS
jgi:hypothetical protein